MNNNIATEMELFKEIGNVKDNGLIDSEDISFGDYIRLNYIMTALGFDSLGIHLYIKHKEKFEQKLNALDKINEECDGYVDLETYNEWLMEFVGKIKDDTKREEIIAKLKL